MMTITLHLILFHKQMFLKDLNTQRYLNAMQEIVIIAADMPKGI